VLSEPTVKRLFHDLLNAAAMRHSGNPELIRGRRVYPKGNRLLPLPGRRPIAQPERVRPSVLATAGSLGSGGSLPQRSSADVGPSHSLSCSNVHTLACFHVERGYLSGSNTAGLEFAGHPAIDQGVPQRHTLPDAP